MMYFKNWLGALPRVKSKISNRMCGISLHLAEMVKFETNENADLNQWTWFKILHSPLHFTELRFWFCNWLRWKICLCRFVFYPLHKTNLKKVHTPRYHLKTPQNFGVQREGSGGGRDKAAVSWPLLSFDQPSLQVQSQQNSQINVERHRLRHTEYRAALMGNECHSWVQSSCHHALTLKMEKPHKNLTFHRMSLKHRFFSPWLLRKIELTVCVA